MSINKYGYDDSLSIQENLYSRFNRLESAFKNNDITQVQDIIKPKYRHITNCGINKNIATELYTIDDKKYVIVKVEKYTVTIFSGQRKCKDMVSDKILYYNDIVIDKTLYCSRTKVTDKKLYSNLTNSIEAIKKHLSPLKGTIHTEESLIGTVDDYEGDTITYYKSIDNIKVSKKILLAVNTNWKALPTITLRDTNKYYNKDGKLFIETTSGDVYTLVIYDKVITITKNDIELNTCTYHSSGNMYKLNECCRLLISELFHTE